MIRADACRAVAPTAAATKADAVNHQIDYTTCRDIASTLLDVVRLCVDPWSPRPWYW